MPDSQQDTRGLTVRIGCISLVSSGRELDLYAYAGHVDFTVGGGRTGRRVREGSIDLYGIAGGAPRDQG